jgi:hypothetical protein
MRTNDSPNPPQAGLLGIAFDATDETKRLTRGKNFILAGGCEETHGRMQETVIKVNEQLDERGKQLGEVSARELRDIFCDVTS